METTILVTKPKQLNAEDKAALRKGGVIVVEAEDPDSVRFLKPNSMIGADGLLYAAMDAITRGRSSTTKEIFADQVAALTKKAFEGA